MHVVERTNESKCTHHIMVLPPSFSAAFLQNLLAFGPWDKKEEARSLSAN